MNQLEVIEARLKAATPGPWKAQMSKDGQCCHVMNDDRSFQTGCILKDAWANGEFIAHAPADLAALLALARAVRANYEAEVNNLAEALKAVTAGRPVPRVTKLQMAVMAELRGQIMDALKPLLREVPS